MEYMDDPALTDYWGQKRSLAEDECGDFSEHIILIDKQLER